MNGYQIYGLWNDLRNFWIPSKNYYWAHKDCLLQCYKNDYYKTPL